MTRRFLDFFADGREECGGKEENKMIGMKLLCVQIEMSVILENIMEDNFGGWRKNV